MSKPRLQLIGISLIWLASGYLVLGAFMDAVSNVQALVNPLAALIGTGIIGVPWLVTELAAHSRGIHWTSVQGHPLRIRRLGPQIRLGLLGMILLLWTPSVLHPLWLVSTNAYFEFTHPIHRAAPGYFTVDIGILEKDSGGRVAHELAVGLVQLKELDGLRVVEFPRMISPADNDVRARDAAGHLKAWRYLHDYGADIFIWGEVLRAGTTRLHWTSAGHPTNEIYWRQEDQVLPDLFVRDLKKVLYTLILTTYVNSDNRGHYSIPRLQQFTTKTQDLLAAHPSFPADSTVAMKFVVASALTTIGEQSGNMQSLAEASRTYQSILKILTRQHSPLDWAMTQNNLGVVLSHLGNRESGTARLDEAVAAYGEALKVHTRSQAPLQWAMTQDNLGNVLAILGEREAGTERLEEAVTLFHDTLLEYTRTRSPSNWAKTQNNLGNALVKLGEREPGTTRLEQAAAAYRESLQERTRDRVPLQWAMTQSNLGTALIALGERESGTVRFEEAVAVLREVLLVYTRQRMPLNWAMAQSNLGCALMGLGKRQSGSAQLEDAVVAFRGALEVFTRQGAPFQWGTIQNSLGIALLSQGLRETGVTRLDEAVAAFQEALDVFRDSAPFQLSGVQRNLEYASRVLNERRLQHAPTQTPAH